MTSIYLCPDHSCAGIATDIPGECPSCGLQLTPMFGSSSKVLDPHTFKTKLFQLLDEHPEITPWDCARTLGVPLSATAQWRSGFLCPHPLLRPVILNVLHNLREKVRDLGAHK